MVPCHQCSFLRQVEDLEHSSMNRVCTRLQVFSSLISYGDHNTLGCHGMGTLGNVPLASTHGHCTAAALSCFQWKAHHKFHVSHLIIEYLQLTITIYKFYIMGNTLVTPAAKLIKMSVQIKIFLARQFVTTVRAII